LVRRYRQNGFALIHFFRHGIQGNKHAYGFRKGAKKERKAEWMELDGKIFHRQKIVKNLTISKWIYFGKIAASR